MVIVSCTGLFSVYVFTKDDTDDLDNEFVDFVVQIVVVVVLSGVLIVSVFRLLTELAFSGIINCNVGTVIHQVTGLKSIS